MYKTNYINRLIDDYGCYNIFCEFVDFLLKNNLTGIFDFPQWSDRWHKGFRIENTNLTNEQINRITEYLNKIVRQIAVINMSYKYDNKYPNNILLNVSDTSLPKNNKLNIIKWTHSSKRFPLYKNISHEWNYEIPNSLKKNNFNFNLELFCRHIDICKILKKYGKNKIAFYVFREEQNNYSDQWYNFSYNFFISKNLNKIQKHIFKHDFTVEQKMPISDNGCVLYIPLPINPYTK